MKAQRPRGIRGRLVARMKATVRFWVDGHQMTYFDVPGQRLAWEYPSYPTVKILQSVPEDGDVVQVGKYTGIHYTTVIIPGGQHHLDWVSTQHVHVVDGHWVNQPDAIHDNGPVIVGNDVFVGFESVISSGVTIGDGAVVAARSMVTKSVEPYAIVGGNPARHIRYRFDEATRAALLRIAWWDWSVEEVARHKDQIHSPDVAGFVARHDPDLGPPSCELCQPSRRTV